MRQPSQSYIGIRKAAQPLSIFAVRRMVRALVTGHWSAAVHDNAVLLACLPLVAYVGLRWLVAGIRGQAYTFGISKRGAYAVLGVAVVWSVVRNLPGWPLKPGS